MKIVEKTEGSNVAMFPLFFFFFFFLFPRFHPNLNKEEIPNLIMYEPDGAFVVRESSSEPGCFALSYVIGRKVGCPI